MSLVWAIREGFSKEVTDQQRPERWDGGQGGERGLLLMGADGGPPSAVAVTEPPLPRVNKFRQAKGHGWPQACHHSVQQLSHDPTPQAVPSQGPG